jgi:hypothetical protein
MTPRPSEPRPAARFVQRFEEYLEGLGAKHPRTALVMAVWWYGGLPASLDDLSIAGSRKHTRIAAQVVTRALEERDPSGRLTTLRRND